MILLINGLFFILKFIVLMPYLGQYPLLTEKKHKRAKTNADAVLFGVILAISVPKLGVLLLT